MSDVTIHHNAADNTVTLTVMGDSYTDNVQGGDVVRHIRQAEPRLHMIMDLRTRAIEAKISDLKAELDRYKAARLDLIAMVKAMQNEAP
jgi:hypothetical protein